MRYRDPVILEIMTVFDDIRRNSANLATLIGETKTKTGQNKYKMSEQSVFQVVEFGIHVEDQDW